VCCPVYEKYNDPDARYCDQCGTKLVGRDDVTTDGNGPPATDHTGPARIVNAAAVDNSPWDAAKAWHNGAEADDPAAFYAGICAGKKAGDKSKQAAWALPYKYTPSSAPNAAAVRNALSRLPQTDDLTNKSEAQSLLESLMKKINPDYDGDADDHAAIPVWLNQITAPFPAWVDTAEEAQQ
jgi:hypothetical protein